MGIFYYLEDEKGVEPTDNIPVLTIGRDELGTKHWFYVAKPGVFSSDFKVPVIRMNGQSFFLNKTKRVGQMGETLHSSLTEDTERTYNPGDMISVEDLSAAIWANDLASYTGDDTIYTINMNPASVGDKIRCYNINSSNYMIDNLGSSNKYSGMNAYIMYDEHSIKSEWINICGNIYEKIIRGLSVPGNWSQLSNSQYGSLFNFSTGFGMPKIRINGDIEKTLYGTVLEKIKKDFLLDEIIKVPPLIAKNIAPKGFDMGLLNTPLLRHEDFKKYDILFKNAGIKE